MQNRVLLPSGLFPEKSLEAGVVPSACKIIRFVRFKNKAKNHHAKMQTLKVKGG